MITRISAEPTNGAAQRLQKLKAEIHRQLVEVIDIAQLGRWKPERLRREVRALAEHMTASWPERLKEAERDWLIEEIMAESFGLGPLEGLMNDPTVNDILCNGPTSFIWQNPANRNSYAPVNWPQWRTDGNDTTGSYGCS